MSMQPVVLSCSQCGEPVGGDEEFCGSCGDFLGWREPDQPAPEVVVADVPMPTAAAAAAGDASPDVSAPVTPGGGPADDPLAPLRLLATQAQEHAEAARTRAMGAQVALERARRRSTSARRRVERLEEQMPPAQERAREAERAVDRAAAASRRAGSAAKGTVVGGDQQRLRELRSRVRAAGRAEKAARTASDAAQASVSTLAGVLAGARGEVAKAPAAVGQAQRERDVARRAADDAQRAAAAALAEVALQERLLALRATPRRVVAMPEQDALRAEAVASAELAVEEVARRAETAERRRLRRAEREDDRRSRAELAADDLELDGVLQGAGAAERAARTAERVVPIAGSTQQDDDDPRAVLPVEVRRRAAVRASRLDLADDDGPVSCPSCGAGNSLQRTLCRSCGVTLRLPEPAAPPPPVVWWRRLLRLDRPAERPFVPAGARPLPGGNPDTAAAVRRARVGGASALRAGGRLRQVAPLVALAAVAALVAVVALTPLSGALGRLVGGGRDRVTERVAAEVELVPLSTRATSSSPSSTPALAVDGDLSTSWTSGAVPGVGEMLGLTFVDARDVVGIRLTSAAGSGRPRPAAVTIVSEGSAGVVLRLADTLREQTFPLDLRDIDDLQIRLDDLYPAEPGVPAGFAEVVVVTREAPRLNSLRAHR